MLSVVVLVLFLLAISSNGGLRLFAAGVAGLVALAAAAAAVGLIMVGQKAHWASDGPGMLLIMIGIALCGGGAFGCGGIAIWLFNNTELG